MKLRSFLLATVCLPLVCHSFYAHAQESTGSADKALINLADLDTSTLKTENGAETSIMEKDGVKVLKMKFPASKSYPGVDFKSPAGKRDLSAYAGVSGIVASSQL